MQWSRKRIHNGTVRQREAVRKESRALCARNKSMTHGLSHRPSHASLPLSYLHALSRNLCALCAELWGGETDSSQDRSCGLRFGAGRGVAIAVVSPLERK